MKESAKYLKLVEWSDEDQCFVGSVPGWIGACCHGDDEGKVYIELCQIVDEWIEIYKKDGKPLPAATAGKTFSGKFQFRPGADLHRALAIKALQAGDSLNDFCIKHLKKVISL